MIFVFLLLAIVFSLVFYYGPGLLVRAMARREFYYTFTPANTFCMAVSEEDESGSGMRGAGHIVNALHGIGGKIFKKSDPNPMNWSLDDDVDPDHQRLFFRTFGVQPMGSIFWKLRVNVDKRLRFGREDLEPEEPHNISKNLKTKHVFYSGELTVLVRGADTADKLGLDFDIDFTFERVFPIRSVVRLADAASFLTSLVKATVNGETASRPADAYYGGEKTKDNREALAKYIEENPVFHKKILDELGLDIKRASIRDVDMTPEHKALMEAEVKAQKESHAQMVRVRNEAAQTIIKARAANKAQILANAADANRVETVLKPLAENERTVAVRFAEALENNESLTSITYAPGTEKMLPVGK